MRVCVISDVHSNLPALKAVLEDIPAVDLILHAGDAVGYGPHPNRVVNTLREHDVLSICGNHDRGACIEEAAQEFRKEFSSMASRSLTWTRDTLTAEHQAYLRSLPSERNLLDGKLRLVHGSPSDPNEYTYPEDFESDLIDSEQVLVLGHTHVQAMEEFNEGLIVNPGSVGQPRDDDARAAYAVVDIDRSTVELHRVSYPVSAVQQDIRAADGLPDKLADRLSDWS